MPASKKPKPPTTPLGRYLRHFTLENVRTFRSRVALDFCQPDGRLAQWTVILGENGTGKTTLLQYLAGMMPSDVMEARKPEAGLYLGPMLAALSWRQWHLNNLSIEYEEPFIRAKLGLSSPASTLTEGRSEVWSPRDAAPASIELVAQFSRLDNPSDGLRGAYFDNKSHIAQQLKLFAYGATRHIAGPASPYLSSETFFKNGGSEPTSTLFHDDYPLISPEQWLLGLHHSSSIEGTEGKHAKRSYESARRCLIYTLPEIADIAVKPRKTGRDQTRMTVMCTTPYGEVPFSALSLGYRTMAAWLIDFVKRMHETYPQLKEPDDGPAVVLIDEFDLHMHPKWQREAMAALSREFPNTQFIVTAHSPLIVQAAGENTKVVVLRKQKRADGGEEVVIDDHPRSSMGWRLDQILQSLYGLSPYSPQHDELMRQRVALRQKEKRTAADNRKLAALEAELDAMESTGPVSEGERLLQELKAAIAGVAEEKGSSKRKS